MGRPKLQRLLYLRFRLADGKQSTYNPAVFDSKARIKPFWCTVAGVAEHHPDGIYYRRYKNGEGKWTWESLGTDPMRVSTLWTVPPKECPTTTVTPAVPANPSEFCLDAEVITYLSNVEKLAPTTHLAYKLTLTLFQESCKKIYMHQITKQDLQAFDSFLMRRGDEDRTRANRIQHVVTFLKNREGRRHGPEIKDVSIRVKFVEAPPEAYTQKELEDLFNVSDEDERFCWRFLLGTGLRESECACAEVTDVNPDMKSIQVTEKPWFGFKPKDSEKRHVPISDELLAQITARFKPNCSTLLFPVNGRPDTHLLRKLKQIAYDGGLNCGKCMGTRHGKQVSCADAPVCEKWILHRFRKNFATKRHEDGASPRSVQKWLGHSSLETTLRYLAHVDDMSDKVRGIVNGVYAGL